MQRIEQPSFFTYAIFAAVGLPLLGRLGQWKLPMQFRPRAFDAGILSGAGFATMFAVLGLQVRRLNEVTIEDLKELGSVNAWTRVVHIRGQVDKGQLPPKRHYRLEAHIDDEIARVFKPTL